MASANKDIDRNLNTTIDEYSMDSSKQHGIPDRLDTPDSLSHMGMDEREIEIEREIMAGLSADEDNSVILREGTVNAKRPSFRSLTPSQKDLIDNKLMVELQLLDAIVHSSQSPRDSTYSLGIYDNYGGNDDPPARRSSMRYVAKPTFIASNTGVTKKDETGIGKKYAYIAFAILSIVSVSVLIAMLLINQCWIIGCSRKSYYEKLYENVVRENQAIFSSKSLEGFPDLLKFNQYLLSTYPTKHAFTVVPDAWMLLNVTSGELLSRNSTSYSKEMYRLSNTPDLNETEIETESRSLGPPICGRLSYQTPILGLIPTVGTDGLFKTNPNAEIRISNFNFSESTNKKREPENVDPESFMQDSYLPFCCILFLDDRYLDERITPVDVSARITCDSGPIAGGVWSGWNSVVKWPNNSWASTINTAPLIDLNSASSSAQSSSTKVVVSGISDAITKRGILMESRADIPLKLIPKLETLFESPNGKTIETKMTAFIPFYLDSYSTQILNSIFSFEIARNFFDLSRIIPRPWSTTNDRTGVLLFDYQNNIDYYRIGFGGLLISFGADGCPKGYHVFNSLCWHPNNNIRIDSSTVVTPTFVPHKNSLLDYMKLNAIRRGFDNRAIINRFYLSTVIQGLAFKLTGINVDLKLRINDINGTRFGFNSKETGKFYLMVDGGINDQRLDEPLIPNADFIPSFDFKIDLENRIGGEWAKITPVYGISGFKSWSEINPVTLKTSARVGSVIIAFLPSKEFQKTGLDLEMHLSIRDVPSAYAPAEQITIQSLKSQSLYAEFRDTLRFQEVHRAFIMKLINGIIGGVTLNGETVAAIKRKSFNDSLIADSLELSGRGKPPKDSSEPFFGTAGDVSRRIQTFKLPTTNNDILPPKKFDLWGRPKDKPINDTLGIFEFQLLSQPMLFEVRKELQKSYENSKFSISQHVMELSFHLRSRLVKNPENRDITRLRKQLLLLGQPFFQNVEPLVKKYIGKYLEFFQRWMNSNVGVNLKDLPDPVSAAHYAFRRFGKRNNVKNVLNEDVTPFDIVSLTASIASALSHTAELIKNDSITFSRDIFSNDYVWHVRGTSQQRNVNDTVCSNGECLTIADARHIYTARLYTESISFSSRMLKLGHPVYFPYEVGLPASFTESQRRDFQYVVAFMDDWMSVKRQQRNAWMTWAGFKTFKLLDETVINNYQILMERLSVDSVLLTDTNGWLLPMVTVSNLQFLAPNSNWTMLTWPEMKAIEILEMANSDSVMDEEIIATMLEFAGNANN